MISLDLGDLSLVEQRMHVSSCGWFVAGSVCLAINEYTLSDCLLLSSRLPGRPLPLAPKAVLWTTLHTNNINNRLYHMTKKKTPERQAPRSRTITPIDAQQGGLPLYERWPTVPSFPTPNWGSQIPLQLHDSRTPQHTTFVVQQKPITLTTFVTPR